MDYDEKYEMNEDASNTQEYECSSCGDWITGPVALDPCIIESNILCDKCAGDLTKMRIDGVLKEVSGRTKRLKS